MTLFVVSVCDAAACQIWRRVRRMFSSGVLRVQLDFIKRLREVRGAIPILFRFGLIDLVLLPLAPACSTVARRWKLWHLAAS